VIAHSFPIVNLRLGQPVQMIATRDFDAFFDYALDQVNTAAAIARAHGLSDEEENQIRRSIGNIQQYTIPMSACSGPVAAPPTCPNFPAAAPVSSGIPWWAAAAAGLGVGVAVAGLLA
jgi:hypothetical protein